MYMGDCSALLGASDEAGESSEAAGESPSISSSDVCRLLRMLSRRKTIEAWEGVRSAVVYERAVVLPGDAPLSV